MNNDQKNGEIKGSNLSSGSNIGGGSKKPNIGQNTKGSGIIGSILTNVYFILGGSVAVSTALFLGSSAINRKIAFRYALHVYGGQMQSLHADPAHMSTFEQCNFAECLNEPLWRVPPFTGITASDEAHFQRIKDGINKTQKSILSGDKLFTPFTLVKTDNFGTSFDSELFKLLTQRVYEAKSNNDTAILKMPTMEKCISLIDNMGKDLFSGANFTQLGLCTMSLQDNEKVNKMYDKLLKVLSADNLSVLLAKVNKGAGHTFSDGQVVDASHIAYSINLSSYASESLTGDSIIPVVSYTFDLDTLNKLVNYKRSTISNYCQILSGAVKEKIGRFFDENLKKENFSNLHNHISKVLDGMKKFQKDASCEYAYFVLYTVKNQIKKAKENTTHSEFKIQNKECVKKFFDHLIDVENNLAKILTDDRTKEIEKFRDMCQLFEFDTDTDIQNLDEQIRIKHQNYVTPLVEAITTALDNTIDLYDVDDVTKVQVRNNKDIYLEDFATLSKNLLAVENDLKQINEVRLASNLTTEIKTAQELQQFLSSASLKKFISSVLEKGTPQLSKDLLAIIDEINNTKTSRSFWGSSDKNTKIQNALDILADKDTLIYLTKLCSDKSLPISLSALNGKFEYKLSEDMLVLQKLNDAKTIYKSIELLVKLLDILSKTLSDLNVTVSSESLKALNSFAQDNKIDPKDIVVFVLSNEINENTPSNLREEKITTAQGRLSRDLGHIQFCPRSHKVEKDVLSKVLSSKKQINSVSDKNTFVPTSGNYYIDEVKGNNVILRRNKYRADTKEAIAAKGIKNEDQDSIVVFTKSAGDGRTMSSMFLDKLRANPDIQLFGYASSSFVNDAVTAAQIRNRVKNKKEGGAIWYKNPETLPGNAYLVPQLIPVRSKNLTPNHDLIHDPKFSILVAAELSPFVNSMNERMREVKSVDVREEGDIYAQIPLTNVLPDNEPLGVNKYVDLCPHNSSFLASVLRGANEQEYTKITEKLQLERDTNSLKVSDEEIATAATISVLRDTLEREGKVIDGRTIYIGVAQGRNEAELPIIEQSTPGYVERFNRLIKIAERKPVNIKFKFTKFNDKGVGAMFSQQLSSECDLFYVQWSRDNFDKASFLQKLCTDLFRLRDKSTYSENSGIDVSKYKKTPFELYKLTILDCEPLYKLLTEAGLKFEPTMSAQELYEFLLNLMNEDYIKYTDLFVTGCLYLIDYMRGFVPVFSNTSGAYMLFTNTDPKSIEMSSLGICPDLSKLRHLKLVPKMVQE